MSLGFFVALICVLALVAFAGVLTLTGVKTIDHKVTSVLNQFGATVQVLSNRVADLQAQNVALNERATPGEVEYLKDAIRRLEGENRAHVDRLTAFADLQVQSRLNAQWNPPQEREFKTGGGRWPEKLVKVEGLRPVVQPPPEQEVK